eukprot:g16444.t1
MVEAALMGTELGYQPLLSDSVVVYPKICCNLEIEIESIFSACAPDTAEQLQDTVKQTRQRNYTTYTHTKNKKLEKLAITTNNVTSEPNETTNEPEQLTERSMVERPKKELNWTPAEGHCPSVDMYAQTIRKCVNA